ncbi:MAG: putative lipase [Planctomycetes bacterium]|nr:putative lipase [Planctomycetota bacterium]
MPPDPAPGPDPIRQGASLTHPEGAWVTPADLAGDHAVVVHGFTASSVYLRDLGRFFTGAGLRAVLFDYDSYRGIDAAAASFASLLDDLAPPAGPGRRVLVAHSMGGLVVRRMLRLLAERRSPAWLRDSVAGACFLGTPHAGTLIGQPLVTPLADLSDLMTGLYPFLRSPLCRSSRQLTITDEDRFIDALNAADRDDPLGIPSLTVSGGMRHLEYCSGAFRNRLLNTWVQGRLEGPNDGLVAESSADLARVLGRGDLPITHLADYPEHPTTNHTFLVRNQSIAARVARWCRDRLAGRGG